MTDLQTKWDTADYEIVDVPIHLRKTLKSIEEGNQELAHEHAEKALVAYRRELDERLEYMSRTDPFRRLFCQ